IILVVKREFLVEVGDDLADVGFEGVDHFEIVETTIQKIRIAVALAQDFELVQMTIGPSHCDLNDFVELVQAAVGDLDSPPDLGIGTGQRDLKLENGVCIDFVFCPMNGPGDRFDVRLKSILQHFSYLQQGQLAVQAIADRLFGKSQRYPTTSLV